MAKIVGLPKLSPTMDEGTLVKWLKGEGDAVEVDDLLAEVETDKATMEFRSFDKGVLLRILVPEGETLAPDTPVAIIGKAGEDVASLVAQVAKGSSNGGASGAAQAATSSQDATVQVSLPQASTGPSDSGAPLPTESTRVEPVPGRDRVRASPVVRRAALEHSIDLAGVRGSGPGGRIVKRDLDAFIGGAQAGGGVRGSSVVSLPTGERPPARIEKASSMRRTIARRLTQSKQEVPHFYLTIDVDAAPLVQARVDLNAELKQQGEKVSLNDMVIKAVASALRLEPAANASWVENTIHYHQRVDISVAVAVDDGLVTPVVRDADRKGVLTIAREVRDLALRARDRKLKPEEMKDGTFSVSNLGMYGIEEFAAVINPPEGAIVAVGTVRKEPVLHDGQVVAGQRMRLTMSCDHRVIDGATGARWLATLRGLIESPVRMLL